MTYDRYKHLLGAPYDEGDHDCYGLALRFFRDLYDIDLPDYARSMEFFARRVDLISDFLAESGFIAVDVPLDRLEVGDGLLLSVPQPWMQGLKEVNHVGVYVGNGMLIHHLYGKVSSEEPLDARWRRRVRCVLRHPLVARMNTEALAAAQVDLMTLLPEHVQQRYRAAADSVLGTNDRAGGPSDTGRADPGAGE